MASISTSSGWGVTFIYEQDLKSAYMNGFLYSIVRPGVYNANMYLTTGIVTDSTSGKAQLLHLNLKKGTTLVFSNDYVKKNEGSGYRRNFIGYSKDTKETILERQVPLLIKCTALRDMQVLVAKEFDLSNGKDCSLRAQQNPNYGETQPPETLYVNAFLLYNQEGEDEGMYAYTPTFVLTKNNPVYGKEAYITEQDSEADKFFFYHTGELYSVYPTGDESTNSSYWRLPDGTSHYSGKYKKGSQTETGYINKLPQFCYLTLGVISEKKSWNEVELKKRYYECFTDEWMRCHTFSGRCLPEYRHHLIGDSNEQSPDFIIPMAFEGSTNDNKFSRLYIDFRNIINYGSVFNTSIDWESAYKITNNTQFPTLSGKKNEDYIDFSISNNESLSLFDKVNEDGTHSPVDFKNCVVIDFSFASTRTFLNIAGDDITEDTFNSNSKIRLFNHREVLTNVSDDLMNTLNCMIVHCAEKTVGYSQTQLALDICDLNTERLVKLITNNSLLSRVINKVRIESELDPVNGESLIPLAISFRTFTAVNRTYKLTSDTSIIKGKKYYIALDNKYTEVETPIEARLPQYFETNIEYSSSDDITSFSSVNPINVLSLLDINYKMNKLSSIESRTQDAYNVLSVIK